MDAKFIAAVMMFSLSMICVAFLVVGLLKALNRAGYTSQRQRRIVIITVICIGAWMTITGLLAINGFFADFSALPPRPALLIIGPLPFILIIAFSKKFATILKAVPPHWLIGMQAFRIVVELLLLRSYLGGLLPKQMTFEGGNLDIITGILAIPVAIIISKRRIAWLTVLYNIMGIALLINVLVITVLSMPTPLRHFMNGPSATIVGEFPFIYLPGVLVVIAYSLHIFSLRQMFITRATAKLLHGKQVTVI